MLSYQNKQFPLFNGATEINYKEYDIFLKNMKYKFSNKNHSIGVTEYGKDIYTSIINKGSIYGCQFHPELSGPVGLNFLNNFVNL